MILDGNELLKKIFGKEIKKTPGKKLCDITQEESAEISTLLSKAQGLQPEKTRIELIEKQIMLDRDKWWNEISRKYGVSGDMHHDGNAIYELVEEKEGSS